MKKILWLSLCLSLLFTYSPLYVWAEDSEMNDVENISAVNIEDNEKADLSGTCGENVFWSFDNVSNTLTISGQGAMSDYNIGEIPWRECDIANIVIGNGVTSIGNNVFNNCSSVVNITICGSVNAIGYRAFANCANLQNVEIQNGVKYIENGAFSGCDKLESIFIPASVVRIENYVFDKCFSLQDIIVDVENAQYSSFDGALYSKGGLELIVCPAGKDRFEIHSGTVTIQSTAFQYCTNLKELLMPDSITTIAGSYIFSDCSSLEKINLSNNIKSLGWRLFANCTSLKEVIIPDSITTLNATFSGCTNLKTVYIPINVVEIQTNTFYHCYNLEEIIYAGNEQQWNEIKIEAGNDELNSAEIIFQGGDSINKPDDSTNTPDDNKPDQPTNPNELSITKQAGGLGSKITVQITSGHWLTVQVRRADSIAITSIQAQGQGIVDMAFFAAAGSIIQIWETESEMTFINGVPDNKILATAVENI